MAETAKTAQILDGKALADRLCQTLQGEVQTLRKRHGIPPHLAVIRVGDDPASAVYVAAKMRRCASLGMVGSEHALPASTSQEQLRRLIERLNADPQVHAMLLQLPLPPGLDPAALTDAIHPLKDVDGFHRDNVGALHSGRPQLVPCTPRGIMQLLALRHAQLRGLHAAVLGRSAIVGRPLAALLLQADCTVTALHSASRNAAALCRQADILVAAVGRAHLVGPDWVKPGATLIDVGMNRMAEPGDNGKGRLTGDMDFAAVRQTAGAITPVPGGCGPMTIACLMQNIIQAVHLQHPQ